MATTFDAAISNMPERPGRSSTALRWSGIGLVSGSWLSAATFGAYILAFYVGAIPAGQLDHWNRTLPGLYDRDNPFAILAIGAHLVTGGILLLLGPVQLIGGLRRRWPSLHRWLGRAYVTAAGIAGLGGLTFILTKGTIGRAPMDAGFGIYGALMLIAAVETWRHARARCFEIHRAWAIRLFALAIGSWLYRMDYGFWSLIADDAGHTKTFSGPFDVFMAFFFYIPNLIVAELFIRGRQGPNRAAVSMSAAIALNFGTFFVGLGTYYFTLYYWGPGIIGAFKG